MYYKENEGRKDSLDKNVLFVTLPSVAFTV